MGIRVLILGASGSGKSTSLQYFSQQEVMVFNVAGKPFPFQKKLDKINNATYREIGKELEQKRYKKYVVEDSQYLLAFDLFNRAKETGYGKFTDIAVRFYNMIQMLWKILTKDIILILMKIRW